MTIHHTENVYKLKKYTADQAWEKSLSPRILTVLHIRNTIQGSYLVAAVTPHKRPLGDKGGNTCRIRFEGYNETM